MAFCETVDAIRKAQVKPRPEDLPTGSLARMLADVERISDTLRMLGIDMDDLSTVDMRHTDAP